MPDPATDGLRLIRGGDLSAATAQTAGMIRAAAISGDLVGARSIWMGRTVLPPGVSSGDHHHGDSETGIYVVSGTPVFVCRDAASGDLIRLETKPGDYVWVPPHSRHREENPSSGSRPSRATTSGSLRTAATGRRTRRPTPRPSS